MKYLFLFIILIQFACSTTSQELNHIPSKTMDLAELKALVNDGSPEKYTILYYSANYCPPCKKVKKVLDSGVNKASFKNIRLIEMDEKDFENGTANPVLARYKIRVVPTFIQVDNDLNELNRNRGRGWKKKNPALDKFIKDVWPDKTPEEKKAEEDKKNQSRDQSRLFAALRQDTSLSTISRGFYQDEYFKAIEAPHKKKTLRIETIEMFEKLVPSDFTDTRHLRLSYNGLSEEEKKQVSQAIPKFTNVEYLYYGGEQFIPEEIFQLKKMKILFLNGGYDRITLSEKIVNLKELEHIQFGYSSIKFPKNIGQLKSLKSIRMPGPALDQPEELLSLENLEILSVKFKSAEIFQNIKKLKRLISLETNLFDPVINELSELRVLKLYPGIVGDISNLKNLEILSFHGSPAHELNASIFSLPALACLFIFDPNGIISFPEVLNSKNLNYVFISYISEWPVEIEVPDYLTQAKHYVKYVRR